MESHEFPRVRATSKVLGHANPHRILAHQRVGALKITAQNWAAPKWTTSTDFLLFPRSQAGAFGAFGSHGQVDPHWCLGGVPKVGFLIRRRVNSPRCNSKTQQLIGLGHDFDGFWELSKSEKGVVSVPGAGDASDASDASDACWCSPRCCLRNVRRKAHPSW